MTDTLLEAIDRALDGDWDRAHQIVQQDESDSSAAWIHAALHRMEGDIGNARYWYRRAGRPECRDTDPIDELRSIRKTLAG
jgi:hypothetical protein